MRVSNKAAIEMYERLGYTVYRRIVDYYGSGASDGDDEDAFGESVSYLSIIGLL